MSTSTLAQPGPTPDSGLSLRDLHKTLGNVEVIRGLSLEVQPGELVALLGPSGCGKTTTLRMIAGFLQPDSGSVWIGDRDYGQVPPEKRPSAMVFQNYALWPTMTVEGNVGFPLKVQKVAKADRAGRVHAALERVNLADKAGRRPARLSGGEQQRVALARALVQEPQLLLLDEPLSNLDAKLRVQVREDIRRIQRELGITTIIVTHDQDEALAISDRIAVMNAGQIEQYSDPITLYHRPATRFVANFIGEMVFLDARLDMEGDTPILVVGQARLSCHSTSATTPGDYVAGLRPEQVRLLPSSEPGTPGTVTRLTPKSYQLEAVVEVAGTELRGLMPVGLANVGDQVSVQVGDVLLFRDDVLVDDAEAATGASDAQPEGDRP